jgi:A/G-specific adenine glycosylase
LLARCVAHASDRVHDLPVRKPKKISPEKHTTMLVIIDRGQVLLEQRPGSGIWGGLLSLPELGGHALAAGEPVMATHDDALALAVGQFGEIESCHSLLPLTHVFTHYKLHIAPWRISLARRLDLAGESGHVWVDGARIAAAPLPAPVKKLLLGLFEDSAQARMPF